MAIIPVPWEGALVFVFFAEKHIVRIRCRGRPNVLFFLGGGFNHVENLYFG